MLQARTLRWVSGLGARLKLVRGAELLLMLPRPTQPSFRPWLPGPAYSTDPPPSPPHRTSTPGAVSQPRPEAPPLVATGLPPRLPDPLEAPRWVGRAGSLGVKCPGSSGRGSRGAVGPLQARSRRQPRPGQSQGNDRGGGQPWRPATASACPRLPTPGAGCIPANSNCAE